MMIIEAYAPLNNSRTGKATLARTPPSELTLTDSFVFINSLLIIWAFQLTLDPTMPLDDMGFMSGAKLNDPPCAIEFETRIPELELGRMMQHYLQVAR
ncbi:hypothetical protein F4604DRAFT_1918745 [Suillus subluteus]|nr:hypothetical protein F4604DRAFT_1918745 [Suillus subluteus]